MKNISQGAVPKAGTLTIDDILQGFSLYRLSTVLLHKAGNAKRLCCELGGEGGYMMTQTKIGTFRADGKRENVQAVCDFVRDFRL